MSQSHQQPEHFQEFDFDFQPPPENHNEQQQPAHESAPAAPHSAPQVVVSPPEQHVHVDEQGTGPETKAKTDTGELKSEFRIKAEKSNHVACDTYAIRDQVAWGQTDADMAAEAEILVREGVITGFDTNAAPEEKQSAEQTKKQITPGFFGQMAKDLFKEKTPGIRESNIRLGDVGSLFRRATWGAFVRKLVHEPQLMKVVKNEHPTETKSVHLATNKIGLPATCSVDLTTAPNELVLRIGRCILQKPTSKVGFTLRNWFNSAGWIGGMPRLMETLSGDGVVMIGGASMMAAKELKDGKQRRADPDLVVAYTTKDPTMVWASTNLKVNLLTAWEKMHGNKQAKFFLALFDAPGMVFTLRDRDDDPVASATPAVSPAAPAASTPGASVV